MRHPACLPADTLGDAIVRCLAAVKTGERVSMTIAITGRGDDATFCTLPSEEYARLRELGVADGITPMLSFLPNGGLNAHRASFEPVAKALLATTE